MTAAEYVQFFKRITWNGSDIGRRQQSALIGVYRSDRATTLAPVDIQTLDEVFIQNLGIRKDEWYQILTVHEIERDRLLLNIWSAKAVATAASPNGYYPDPDSQNTLYPRSGWLGKYVYEYCASFESPDSFLFWSGVAILSATIRRKIWIQFGTKQVFPNFYVFLVAEAGKARKDAPIKAADHFARAVPGMNFIDRTTTERLPHDLAYRIQTVGGSTSRVPADAHGFLCATELVAVLDTQTYNEGVMKFLLDWWDSPAGPKNIKSIKHNVVTLTNIHVTALAGTTPGLMIQGISSLIASGGMLSRGIYVCEDRTNKVFPWPLAPDPAVEQDLINHLLYIDTISGEFIRSPKAIAWNEAWYRPYVARLRSAPPSYAVTTERRQEHMIKLAMILAVSENMPLELTDTLLIRADKILEEVYQAMPALTETLQANPLGKEQVRVKNHIKDAPNGLILHSDLLRKNSPTGLTAAALKEIIATLVARDEVEVTKAKTPKGNLADAYKYVGGTP